MNEETIWYRKVLLFLVSQGITLFGSSLVQMAIIWYVTLQTSSGIWVSLLTLCSFIPQMVISFAAGVWADRYNRKRLIIIADSLIACATLLLVIFLLIESKETNRLLAITGVSFIRSIGSGIQTPAVNAMIPQLVPKSQLMRFNGINSTIQSVIQFASPAIAGAIMALGSIQGILLIDVFTAIIGIIILFLLKMPKQNAKSNLPESTFFKEVKQGLHHTIENPAIGKLFLKYGLFIFLSVPSGFLVTLIIERTFGANYFYLSTIEIIGFAGMLVAGLLLSSWGGFKNRRKTIFTGMIGYGIFAMLLGLTTNFWLFAVVMFFVSFMIPVIQSSVMTILQEEVAEEIQGRIFSLLNAMFSGVMPLGMVIFGPLSDMIPIVFLLLITGILILCLGLFSLPTTKIEGASYENRN